MENKETEKKNKDGYKFYKDSKVVESFLVGLGIGLIILLIVYPDRIATLKNGEKVAASIKGNDFTAESIYEDMRDYVGINLLLNDIDEKILDEEYELDSEQTEEVNAQIDEYLNMYSTNYGITESEFYARNNFKNRQEFFDVLAIDYKKNLVVEEYIKKDLTEDEIKEYYDEYVFGDTETQYIVVATGTNEDEIKDNKALANKIIKKAKDGDSYSKIVKAYKDDDTVTYKDLETIKYDNTEVDNKYKSTLVSLKDNSYTTKYVETSTGYMIIFKGTSKTKPELKSTKEYIEDNIIKNKLEEDNTLYYKSLIELREKYDLKINDSEFKKLYEDYKETNTTKAVTN